MYLYILLSLHMIVDFSYSGCKVIDNTVISCHSGKLSDPVPNNMNHRWVLKRCSTPMNLSNLEAFCLDKDWPKCAVIHEGFQNYVKDPNKYNEVRLKYCFSVSHVNLNSEIPCNHPQGGPEC